MIIQFQSSSKTLKRKIIIGENGTILDVLKVHISPDTNEEIEESYDLRFDRYHMQEFHFAKKGNKWYKDIVSAYYDLLTYAKKYIYTKYYIDIKDEYTSDIYIEMYSDEKLKHRLGVMEWDEMEQKWFITIDWKYHSKICFYLNTCSMRFPYSEKEAIKMANKLGCLIGFVKLYQKITIEEIPKYQFDVVKNHKQSLMEELSAKTDKQKSRFISIKRKEFFDISCKVEKQSHNELILMTNQRRWYEFCEEKYHEAIALAFQNPNKYFDITKNDVFKFYVSINYGFDYESMTIDTLDDIYSDAVKFLKTRCTMNDIYLAVRREIKLRDKELIAKVIKTASDYYRAAILSNHRQDQVTEIMERCLYDAMREQCIIPADPTKDIAEKYKDACRAVDKELLAKYSHRHKPITANHKEVPNIYQVEYTDEELFGDIWNDEDEDDNFGNFTDKFVGNLWPSEDIPFCESEVDIVRKYVKNILDDE